MRLADLAARRRAACLLVVVAAVGCDKKKDSTAALPGNCPTGMPTTSASSASSASAPAAPAPTQKGRLYIDIASNMRGFTKQPAALANLFRSVRTAMDGAGANASQECTVGGKPVCLKFEEADAGAEKKCLEWGVSPEKVECWSQPVTVDKLAQPTFYAAESSKLDDVLVRKPRPERIDPDRPPPPDSLDASGLTVLVTSPFEPGASKVAEGASAASACSRPTPQCIATALRARRDEGYGVWLVAAQLEFEGTYPSMIARGDSALKVVRSHLDELQRVREGEKVSFPGVKLDVSAQSPATLKQPYGSWFRYKGVRPVVILALSRDAKQGREFVRTLEAEFKRNPNRPGRLGADDVLRSVELAPLAFPTYRLAAVSKDASDQQGLDPTMQSEFKEVTSTAAPPGLVANAQCGARGAARLRVQAEETPGAIPVPSYLSVRPLLQGPSGEKLPPDVGKVETLAGPLRFGLGLWCTPLAVCPSPWSFRYQLGREVKFFTRDERSQLAGKKKDLPAEEQRAYEETERAWWSRSGWSAENDHEMPERIFGLEEVVETLLEAGTRKTEPMGDLDVRVKRLDLSWTLVTSGGRTGGVTRRPTRVTGLAPATHC